MKKFNKIIAMIMVIGILVSVLPINSLAQDSYSPNPANPLAQGIYNSIPAEPLMTASSDEGEPEIGGDLQATQNNTFNDVKASDWYYDAVSYALQNDIFNGTGSQTFSPLGTMTRAMYVTVMGRIAGVNPADYSGSGGFTDVSGDAYYAPYVVWAEQKGITKGVMGNSFGPSDLVTREQMAALTVRFFDAYGIAYPEATVTTKPADLDGIASWAQEPVMKLWACGLFNGDENGNFNPRNNATRAEGAAFCMRTDKTVEKWMAETNLKPATPEEPQKPQNPSGGHSSGGTSSYIVSFNTNGGSSISAMSVDPGKTLSDVPSPKKESAIFLGWYTDAGLTNQFYAENPVNQSLTLYAKYAALATQQEFADESFSLMDQAPGLAFSVNCTGNLTATEIKDKLSLEIVDNSEYVSLVATGENGVFTVKADGGFTEGSSYKLTLNDESLSFADKPTSLRNCTFTIAKAEIMALAMNDGLVYIKSSDISEIKKDGEPVASLSVALVGKVDDIQADQKNNADNQTITGTFIYANAAALTVGDVLCVYDSVKPGDRNTTDDYANDSISYVKVTAISGTTVSYQNTDPEQVLFLPDTLPLKESDLSSYDPTGTFTEKTIELDFSAYSDIGLDEKTTVDKGDFIVILETDKDVVYGKVTDVSEDGDITTVTFALTTLEEMKNTTLDYYTKDDVSGETMLEGVDVADAEKQLALQAMQSGFAEQALVYLASVAIKTEGFQAMGGADDFIMTDETGNVIDPGKMSPLGLNFEYENDDITVKVLIDDETDHFGDGLKCVVEVSGEIAVDVNDDSEIKIGLQASFEEEIKVSTNAKGKAVWYQTSWWPNFWYIGDYQMNANVDLYSYTGVSLKATVSSAEKEEEGSIDVIDISEQLKDLMANEEEDEITAGAQDLFEAYGEMLDNETDYMSIAEKNITEVEVSDPLHILCIAFKVNISVQANINLALGSNFEYECGNRYSFWFKIKEKASGSSTMQLIDEKYTFQFYAMGELGLRVGIQLEFAVGLFSTKLDSVGFVAEVGPYVELFGYFFYELNSVKVPGAAAKIETKMSGALYIEFGIYLIISFKAQLGDGKLEANPTLYEHQWPILYAGEEINVHDFAYQQPANDEKTIIKDTTYTLSDSLRNMACLNLTEGDLFQDIYGLNKFYYNLSNPNFALNGNTITVTVPENVRYMECDLTITWGGAKLAFSRGDLKRTIHLVWTNLTDMEMTQKYDIYVKAGDKTIWSAIVNKGETPVLPTPEEVLKLIGYHQYMDGVTDLKYAAYTGYDSVAIPAQGNKTYNFAVTEKEYTLKVKDVENTDGTKTDKTFTAKFGEAFDLSTLAQSGSRIKGDTVENTKYTRYLTSESNTVAEKTGKAADSVIDSIFAKELLAGTYTYTAKYEDNSCLVTYKFSTAGNVTIPPVTEKIEKGTMPTFDYSEYLLSQGEGYVVKSWDSSIGRVMNDTTFTAACGAPEGEKLTIAFDSNGGSEVTPMNRYKGAAITAPQEPTRTGYTFDCWCSDEGLQAKYVFDKMPAAGFTLYAKWIANQYTVTFNVNGGNGDNPTKQVTYAQTYGELPIPTKDGSGFEGWYTTAEAGDKVTAETTVSITAPQTIFAHWKAKETVSGISKAVQTFTYDGEAKTFAITGTALTGFTVKYKKPADTDWSNEAVNAGKYAVQITRPADDIYSAYESVLTDTLIINKASRTISAPTGGTAYYSTISANPVSAFTAYGDGDVEYAASTTTIAPASGWSKSLSIVNLYSVGDYYLFARVTEGNNYLSATSAASAVTVKIEQPLDLINRSWTVGVQTGTDSGAGTGAKVEIVFNYIVGGYSLDWHELDSSENDFENGDFRNYTVNETKDPWILKGFDIGNDGGGAGSNWQCSYAELSVDGFGPVKIPVNAWFDNAYGDYYTDGFKRNITSTGGFDIWGGTYDVSSSSAGNIAYSFDGNITDQYGTYNAYAHYDAPVINVDTSEPGYSDCFSYKVNSFTIDKAALYEKMTENGDDQLVFTISLNFDSRSANTTQFTKTVIINRE